MCSTFVLLFFFNIPIAGVLSLDDESQRRLKYVYPGWKPEYAKNPPTKPALKQPPKAPPHVPPKQPPKAPPHFVNAGECTYKDLSKESFAWQLNRTSIQLKPQSCLLPTDFHSRACLRHKHIVLVGDSLTRYQYLNLVNYLESRKWELGPEPYSELELQWKNWTSFYEGTNGRLRGNEICDCYRSQEFSPEDVIENRFYENKALKLRVSYIQLFFPERGSKGHDLLWLSGASRNNESGISQKGCKPGYCDAKTFPVHWELPVVELLEEFVGPVLKADILVFNSGF